MYRLKSINLIAILLFAMAVLSCKDKINMMTVSSTEFHEYTTSDDIIPINILEAVEGATCKNGLQNANVYKVKVFPSQDTIYVFEICKEMVWRADNLKEGAPFAVQVSKDKPSNFLIPATVNIHKRTPFLFGEILRVKY